MPVPSYALALNSHSTDNAALAGDVAFLTPMDGDMEFTWDMDMSANAFHSAQGTDSPISGDDSSPWYPDFTFADASLTAATDSAWPNDIYPSPRISNHATVATTTTSLGIELLNRGHCIKDSSINQSDDVPICPLASAAIISSSSRTTSGHSCLTEAIEILKSMKGERAAHTAAAAAAAAPFKTMVSANHRALARATAILEARECQCAAVDYHVMVIAILIAAEAAEQFSAAVRRGCGGSGPPSDGGDAGVRDLARLVRGEIHQLMHIIEARTICEDRLVRAGPAATAAASPSPGGLSSEYARAVLSSVLTQLEADLRAKLRSLAKDTTRILQQLWEPSE
ncbi:hypothetical protein N0V82_002381 [Gnomoniopsis sp. IMI 355080]|nr:hypothetical protein N0V82_002381 [Gnomoniopsis sp. IMI 355080]